MVKPEKVKGRSILIVDDVMTTGTTAGECARVLRRAGAKEVFVATVARATKEAGSVMAMAAGAYRESNPWEEHRAMHERDKTKQAPLRRAPPEPPKPRKSLIMQTPVLVLNASYEPINICAARRAIVLVLKGVAMTEEENGHFLHAARLAMRVPSVIRLLEYRRIPHQTRALSRKNILAARPQHLPVLRRAAVFRRTDAGPRDPALARRIVHMGKPGRLLPSLQPPQRATGCWPKPT